VNICCHHYSLNDFECHLWLMAWRNGSTLCPINEVALHRAGLVHKWVTACGQVNHLGI